MASALQLGEDQLAGDALSVSLILAAVAGTVFLVVLQVLPEADALRFCPLSTMLFARITAAPCLASFKIRLASHPPTACKGRECA